LGLISWSSKTSNSESPSKPLMVYKNSKPLTMTQTRGQELSVNCNTPIRRGFAPDFVNYKKRCTRLATASDKVYQLLTHGRWFSPGTPASSITKTGRHEIAEILLKVALNTKNHQSINCNICDSTLNDDKSSWR